MNSLNQNLNLIGIVPNVVNRVGLMLLELVKKVNNNRVGNCIIIEASFDLLTLIDKAQEYGARRVILLGGEERQDLPPGIIRVAARDQPKEISHSDVTDVIDFVRRLWPSLTGSLDVRTYVDALELLSPIPYEVYTCNLPDIDEGLDCEEQVRRWIENLCPEDNRFRE